MRNLFLFFFLTFITGNPIIAIIIIIAIYIALDYRYVGFSRYAFKSIKRNATIRSLKRLIAINPHDAPAHRDLGRYLVEAKKYSGAIPPLEMARERIPESPDIKCDLGMACIATGKAALGEEMIKKAYEEQPRFRYGEPYLRWGEYLINKGESKKAEEILLLFELIHSSSVEGLYHLGEAHRLNGDLQKAMSSYDRALLVFKQSPKYKRRTERLWAWRVRFRKHLIRSR